MRLYAIPVAIAGLALAAFIGVAFAENIDPSGNASQFAWSENTGWLNAEPANCSDCGMQVSNTGLTGYMWGENIGWINLSCKNNATCAGPAGNWGVTNNGSGTLGGYAWAENAGWISFSCANTTCAGPAGSWGVTVSGSTGSFSGSAWGENIGWISFSDTSPIAYQVQTSDDDGDGLFAGSDNCQYWANASQTLPDWPIPAGDSDCDGYPDSAASGPPTLRNSEQAIGTLATVHCAANTGVNNEPPPDAWPPDFNDNQLVNVGDIVFFNQFFGKHTTDPDVNLGGTLIPVVRFDLNNNGIVNVGDVLQLNFFMFKRCA
jgi:hypothetical protein